MLPANTTSYNDTGLTPGETYTYRIRAYVAVEDRWNSPYSYNVSAITSTSTNGYGFKPSGRQHQQDGFFLTQNYPNPFNSTTQISFSLKYAAHTTLTLYNVPGQVVANLIMVQSLGSSATPISWGELYTALQQGVVDGAENNPPSFYLSKHYEVCKYYCLDEHTFVPDILLMSTRIWKNLNTQEQKWLQEAVDESVVYQRKLWKESSEQALQAVKDAGVQVIEPDKTPFRDAVVKLHDSYKGTAIYDLISEIKSLQ